VSRFAKANKLEDMLGFLSERVRERLGDMRK